METISAYEARVKFGDLLNRVYYGGVSIEIERYGNPIAKIIPPDTAKSNKKTKKTAMDKLMKFAGILSDEEAKVFMKVFQESRSKPAIKNISKE